LQRALDYHCLLTLLPFDDHFRIDSGPQGATVTTSIETLKSQADRRRGKTKTPIYEGCSPTPCAIQLPRRSEFIVKIKHEGYEPTEMFVTHSSKKGSLTANMAATTTTVAGTTAVGVGTYLATEAVFVGIGNAFVTAFGGNGAVFTGTSTSTAASAAAGPALAVTGGMLLFDAASGANQNLFPNPVVLELAPIGTPTRKDPLVPLYWEKATAELQVKKLCPKNDYQGSKKPTQACRDARKILRQKKRPIDEAVKAALKPK